MIPGSILADYYSRKKILFLGIITYTLYLIIFGVSTEFFFLLLGSLFNGFSWGIYNSSFTALLAENTEGNNRTYVFSFNAFLFNLAFIIGNLSLGLVDIVTEFSQIIPLTSYKMLFLFGAFLSFLSLIPLFYYREETVYSQKVTKSLTIRSKDVVIKFSLVNFLIGFGAGLFIPFIPLYMNLQYGASDAVIGNTLAISNAVIAIAFLVSPRIVDKIGAVKSIVVTQGLSILPLLILPQLIDVESFIVFYSIRAVLMNMASPVITSYMMGVVETNERASVSGITATAWTGGSAISSVIAGFIMDVSLELPVYFCSIFYVLSTVLFYYFFRKKI
jgi:MFS family permease